MSKTYKELFKLAVQGCLSDQAEDVGVYCAKVVDSDGKETLRTEYQNGWNDATSEILHKRINLLHFYEKLTDTQKDQLGELLLQDGIVWMHNVEGKVYLELNMNDTFAYACSEGEHFTVEDLPTIYGVYKEFGHSGLTAWASQKNGREPLKSLQTEKYKQALEYLKGLHK